MFNSYKNITYLESETAQGLEDMIRSFKLPVHVVDIYFAKNKHYAWIVTGTRIIKKQIKKGKQNEITS